MLGLVDVALIVATALACSGAVTLLAWLGLRWNRRGSIGSQFAIVVGAAIASIGASTLAVMAQMYVSAHDSAVLAWVLGVSAAVTLTLAWIVTARTARASITGLIASAHRMGDGDVVPAAHAGWREFGELAAELADASQRLADARAEIERLDTARRQFFAWISHDLRTPLTGMRATAEALESGVVADREAALRLIRDKVDTVSRMVDDLFELSKLQSGTLQLHPELVVLLDLVSDAVADVLPIARPRGIRIEQRGIEHRMLWADPRELTRAIGNLLSNGVRHAPDDSEIVVSADTLDDGRLVLSVLDQGPGVAVEDLGSIFDVGWRADAARTPTADADGQTPGAGLGLAIVRGIAEAHGGDVRAERTDDGFRLELILPAGAPG